MECNGGRFAAMMAIDLTYRCNLRCKHCFNYSGEHNLGLDEVSEEQVMKMADEVIEMCPEVVCLCGGETLLRKEVIYKFAKKVTENTNGNCNVNIVTNGHLLTKEIAHKLKESGISYVQVSLDGSSNNTYDWLRNKEGGFQEAVNGIKLLKAEGIEVLVSCTPTKKNIDEYPETTKLCSELGVYEFRVQPLMLLGRAKENLAEFIPDNKDYIKIKRELNKASKELGLKVQWGDPIEHLTRGAKDEVVENVSFNIDAYGYLEVSPYLPIRVGHINNGDLIEYWNNGYNDVWNFKFIKEMCELIKCAENMELNNVDKRIPRNFIDKPLVVDILKYENVKDMSLEEVLKINQ